MGKSKIATEPRSSATGVRHRPWPQWLTVVGAAVALVAVLAAVAVVPTEIADSQYPTATLAEKIDATTSLRLHFLYVLGGLVAIATLIYTHLRHARERDQLALDRARLRNERFGSAIAQLAHESLTIRQGGVFTLERLARESADERDTVFRVLHAFVQAHSTARAGNDHAPIDVVTAFSALTRQPLSGTRALRLEGVSLRGMSIDAANLTSSTFLFVDFSGSTMFGLSARDARFKECNLEGARLVFHPSDGVHIDFCRATDASIAVSSGSAISFRESDLSDSAVSVYQDVANQNYDECLLDRADVTSYHVSGAGNVWTDDSRMVEKGVPGVGEHVYLEYIGSLSSSPSGRELRWAETTPESKIKFATKVRNEILSGNEIKWGPRGSEQWLPVDHGA